jgi:electron transfer flavoprotein beta subunit
MNIAVLAKLVPDLVEELSIDETGTTLDSTWLRLILNEFDDYALEQAILLKERTGTQVTIIVPDMECSDDVLFAAAAKGVDRLVRLRAEFGSDVNNHALARAFAFELQNESPDLILTGVQAHNDLDGALGPLVAGFLDLPYVGYVSSVTLEDGSALVHKEHPGGLLAEIEVSLPAVFGVQAAERPLSYVPYSKIRQAMKTAVIEDQAVPEVDPRGGAQVERMYKPESGTRAEMITGSIEEISTRLVKILQESGVL